ncbi:putative baseplate assembly protein [Streptomyces zhaozhouensis]|uniref:Putative baseplate assembly protein n=1 Tax=Streptomyces zhaozhouensis TaxID=1300267 RepID=A0A286E938_9ACTN|nr:baseplate J/gp47 family protein [Streptomyces zhaozhouensis]SOD67374.1 putative baseplate assembly protein [Streptomyces zhaozhouensis]
MSGDTARASGRRGRIRATPGCDGVDGVEVGDDGLTLTVTFLGKAPHGLGPEHVRIDGGRRITGVEALGVEVEREEDPELDDRLHVRLNKAGDTSVYRVSLVAPDPFGRPGTDPLPGLDQRYHGADFTFAPQRPRPLDPETHREEPPARAELAPPPASDHVARDYASFRRLLLDRVALTAPDWVERNPADLGVTLVELLAYTADQLSYQQDAVATEAYLDTARSRVSLRRHARLVDYPVHDGCSARALVVLRVREEATLGPGEYRFAAVETRAPELDQRPAPRTVLTLDELAELEEHGAVEVFEPLDPRPVTLRPEHNAISLWTWDGEVEVLPRGSTSATLRDAWTRDGHGSPDGEEPPREREGGGGRRRRLALRPGDLLLFEEVRGPHSGTPGDADPSHRQVVRLTSVTPAVDQLLDQPVVEVRWSAEDALTFPLHVAGRGGPDRGPLEDVALARGNVLAVDHGRTHPEPGFDGPAPEVVTVPPDPTVPHDRAAEADHPATGPGNPPARLINALRRQTGHGRPLDAAQVGELFRLVGAEATRRAGLDVESAGRRSGGARVVPSTAPAQAEALETLLAQTTYPGIPAAFRPRPRRQPVAQTVPFPDPRHIAAGQAAALAGVPERVRTRLVELWRSARDREGLDEAEIAELTTLFGAPAVERLQPHRQPARALAELLHRRERLLGGKLKRLAVLTARARAGRVLDERVVWELTRAWGPPYAAGLLPEDPALHGPAAALPPAPAAALPAIRLWELADDGGRGQLWEPRRDLLDSGPWGAPRPEGSGPSRDHHFVGELENDGRLALRFGDGAYGARPRPGSRLELRYRVGGGTAGNVGAGAIRHLVLDARPEEGPHAGSPEGRRPFPVVEVRNPLPAVGGAEPESLADIRRRAPLAPRREPLRAVTAADYARLASGVPGVARAAAELRFTGAGHEAHVAVDARGLGPAEQPAELLAAVAAALEPVRRIGHHVVVGPARPVPLEVALAVCAAPGHQHGQIVDELYRVLGAGTLPGGRLGFFHPDALTFGEPVRLSRLVAAAAAVRGVRAARVTRLHRQFHPPRGEREDGVLRLGPLEVAQCDNDPDLPENGRLTIELTPGGDRR